MELHYWWELANVTNMNKLLEWKPFVDDVGIKSNINTKQGNYHCIHDVTHFHFVW